MAFTQVSKDMDIIAALDDEPNDVGGLTAGQLKAKFDEGGKALKTYINGTLLTELESSTGGANIGISATGITATKLNGALAELKTAVDAATVGTLPNGSVTTNIIQDGAVTTAKIPDNAITTAKLAATAVTAAKLAADAVETAKIKDGAVTDAKLAAASVVSGKIGTDAVDTANLADSAVTTAKIADGAVTSAKLDSDATRLRFTSVAVATSAWASDETYDDYPYRASVTLTGGTATMRPEVCFAPADADSGNFAPVADSHAGGLYLYAKAIPADTVTIPVIDLVR